MSDQVRIRAITEADIGAFHAAVDAVARERRYLRRPEGPSLESATGFVRANIREGNPQFVATDGAALVGWCDIVRSSYPYERHVGVLGMGVLPGWRGRGIGRRLLDAALADAGASGILRVELGVYSSNGNAIALYRDSGFDVEGLQRHARRIDGRFEDILLMARLDPAFAE